MRTSEMRRKLNRAYAGNTGVGVMMPEFALEAEIERRRTYLSEELLKILAESVSWDNSSALQAEVADDLLAMAKAAIAAAAVIHPDLSEEDEDKDSD